MRRTEFFEAAVRAGFYGIERSGIYGKKDNVRKYWEDVFIKTAIRPSLELMLTRTDKVRIIDLGSGSGEGLELLTHVPPSQPIDAPDPFVLRKNQIAAYAGVDISPAMVAQGTANYQGREYARFLEADLSEGFPLPEEPPFDIYFSSYCSLSHLTADELQHLSEQIFAHARNGSVVVYDVYGRCSPEWPSYWGRSAREQLPYNMGYLLTPQEQDSGKVESFDATFWTGQELTEVLRRAAATAGVEIRVLTLKDRSILVGRHMDTCFFKPMRLGVRKQVNRLFDRDYRGDTLRLSLDLSYLDACRDLEPEAYRRIERYHASWSAVVDTLDALMKADNPRVRRWIESSPDPLADDLKMLAWLYRNADRFQAVDFWASVMGPQVACVLRNLEFNLPDALGCGHSLCGIVQVCK